MRVPAPAGAPGARGASALPAAAGGGGRRGVIALAARLGFRCLRRVRGIRRRQADLVRHRGGLRWRRCRGRFGVPARRHAHAVAEGFTLRRGGVRGRGGRPLARVRPPAPMILIRGGFGTGVHDGARRGAPHSRGRKKPTRGFRGGKHGLFVRWFGVHRVGEDVNVARRLGVTRRISSRIQDKRCSCEERPRLVRRSRILIVWASRGWQARTGKNLPSTLYTVLYYNILYLQYCTVPTRGNPSGGEKV